MKHAIRRRILQVPTTRLTRDWLKRIKFKGHGNLSLYKFLKIFLYNINEDEIMDRSYGVAFNFILAIFPAIIFLFTLIPYVSVYFPEITTETIMHFLQDAIPVSMYESVSSTVIDIVFFIAISCIYYFGPAVHYNWSFFSVGSTIATLSVLGISYGFSFYITNFGSYNKVYGSIGALIALMAWVQLITLVLLFGYEINASLYYGRKMEAITDYQRSLKSVKSFR